MEITGNWMCMPASLVKAALSPKGKAPHVLALVVARMAPAIGRYGLKASRGPFNEAVLENAHARLHLSGLYQDRVLCRFSGKRQRLGGDFDLSFYLYVRFQDWALELLPRLEEDWSDERRVLHCLDGFNSLLLDGWLQEPLEGDFSWVADYRRAESEACALLQSLDTIKEMDCGAWAAIRAKIAASDHTWMNDAHGLIYGRFQADGAVAVLPPTDTHPVEAGVI